MSGIPGKACNDECQTITNFYECKTAIRSIEESGTGLSVSTIATKVVNDISMSEGCNINHENGRIYLNSNNEGSNLHLYMPICKCPLCKNYFFCVCSSFQLVNPFQKVLALNRILESRSFR